jgi:MoaA/NifB/PqqE/SkfB family radical SAM enzyme
MRILSHSETKKVYKIWNIIYKQFFDIDWYYSELFLFKNEKLKGLIPQLLSYNDKTLLLSVEYIEDISDKLTKIKKISFIWKLYKYLHLNNKLQYYKFNNDSNKLYFENQIIYRISYIYKKKWLYLTNDDTKLLNCDDKSIVLNINDAQFKNFIFTDSKAYFCDLEMFEFSSKYMWIADFFTSNNLSSYYKKYFFKSYINKYNKKILNIYIKYLNIVNNNYNIPKYIDHLVPINNVCNQSCNFCSAEYRMEWNKSIPLKDIFKQILEKDDYIQISGGEPLLNSDLFKILYFIRKHKQNCFIEFQSNWVLLLNNKNLENLEKFNIWLYNINYPCHIEEVNDEIVRWKWSFFPREKAMKEIIRRWLNLRINIIVNTINYKYLPEMVDYINIQFKWLERIQFSFTKAMWAANKNEEVVAKYEDTEKYFIESLAKCRNYWIKADVDHIPMCFLWKFFENHVDYHKMKSWEKWVFLEEKNYVERCKWCDKKDLCTGYRKDYLEIYSEKNEK